MGMNPAHTLLTEIELIRKREGLTQTRISEFLGITQPSWAAIRGGREKLPLHAAESAKQRWPELTTPVLRYYEFRAQRWVAEAKRKSS